MVFICIIGTLVSCDQPTTRTREFLWAENTLKEDSVKGIKMLTDISDSVFSSQDFYKYHNVQCIANVYYYKTLQQLDSGDFDEAQLSFLRLILFRTEKLNGKQPDTDSLLLKERIFLRTMLNSSIQNDSIAQELKQQLLWFKNDYDLHYKEKKTLTIESHLSHSSTYWLFVLFLVVSILFMLLYQKQNIELGSKLFDQQRREKQLIEEIDKLSSQTIINISEISQLKRQLDHIQDMSSLRLGRGKNIFEIVQAGGTMKNISVEDEQCFIDYFIFTHPQQFHQMMNQYTSVTLRHTTYLILSQLGFCDREICRILYVKESTIRNYRMRINKKRF